MNVYLLYENKEWLNIGSYFDQKNIVQDLGLSTLFSAASKPVVKKNGKVTHIDRSDAFVADTMKKVMMIPLTSKEEILYRQDVTKDCFSKEAFFLELYRVTSEMLEEWNRLGRRDKLKTSTQSPVADLILQIRVLKLFVATLGKIKILITEQKDRLESDGFKRLYNDLENEFSSEIEDALLKILKDISFYTDISETELKNHPMLDYPKVLMECGVGDGLKLCDIRLENVATVTKKYRKRNGAFAYIQEQVNSLVSDAFSVKKNSTLKEQSTQLEFQIVSYVVGSCNPFMNSFEHFFDQLRFQLAFYKGALNLRDHLQRFNSGYCFPVPGAQDVLNFRELKEPVMCMEQRINAIGNTCNIQNKMLMIVTGANQGGKSTFLRSIGIAQIMMQCGLIVAAEYYESGIFPEFFTHFTRREDSSMNSGRLDEELQRMDRIIKNIGSRSLVLLNESFASTTEKEGSVIAYDIIKALTEIHVKVLTVTHLLSFAQKVYDESGSDPASRTEFFCAERLEDGRRTYKMYQHAPELTSFGLDLYDEIVNEQSAK